jgi:hypothetical protein
VLFGLFGASGRHLRGFGLSAIGLINTGSVQGAQVSGIFNYTGGNVDGIQAGGIFNLAQGDVRGVQASGLFNYTGGNVDGIQAGGIFNLAQGDVLGIQAGGIFNYTGGGMDGSQIAPIFNLTQGDVRGGIQAGGIFNYTGGDMDGVQIAPIFNMTRGRFRGLQMGLVNYTDEDGDDGEGGGVRIGVVNISKNEKVVPIGLVNIIKNGIFHPVVWYDDMGFLNLGLRSGSKYFYSIFSMGVRDSDSDSPLLLSRTGVGGEIPLGRFFINMDLMSGNLIDRKDFEVNILLQARLSGGFKVFERLGVFGGVSYDWFPGLDGNSHDRADDLGIAALRWENDRNIHKIGFFGGIQF